MLFRRTGKRCADSTRIFVRGQLEISDVLMSEDHVNHDPVPGRGPTREHVPETAASLHDQLVEISAQIDRIACEGDLVAVQGSIIGVSYTGERTQIKMSEFFRLENGRIAERWS